MSQRILKCTVCGGDHSIFHCENRCGVCHGDSRQCSCNERLPQKRKKTSKSTASSQQPADISQDDLKKKYKSLQKDYKRVGQAFQNQQEQNQELTALLEERDKEAEELANLVRDKDKVVKNLERRLLNAKKVIAELREEVRCRDQPTPQEDPPASQQQHQQTADSRVSNHSQANIHKQYDQVLQTMKENKCCMACAFRLAGCPRSTLQDFVGIAELKKVDSRELDLILHNQRVTSVRDLAVVCHKRLQCYIPVMSNTRREGQLLPMKFEARFYE
ncbi:early endosome antigen 1-like [Montipora foliosa]|uniref:early endosome antigen 1-like n=1 Tax=Montipora foliosa TaxID=591990 RepID=UPI0035F16450